MSTRERELQILEALAEEIARQSADRQATWSALATELLEESVRMRRAPGVAFADGPAGRRAIVAGTGIDVWEVVAAWRACGEDFGRLRRSYDWLTEPQLRAALVYYQLYPEEIDARLKVEAAWTPERVASEIASARSGRG